MQIKTSPSNLGAVVSVRGSVVDIRFDAHLPPILSLLHAKDGEIAIEVLAQLDAHRVRGIALTPTQGLARGMAVEDTGGPLKAPVGKGIPGGRSWTLALLVVGPPGGLRSRSRGFQVMDDGLRCLWNPNPESIESCVEFGGRLAVLSK